MAGITDYTNPNQSLSDFIPDTPISQGSIVSSPPSNTNYAVHAALLDTEGDPIGKFQAISEDLVTGPNSPVARSIIDNAAKQNESVSMNGLTDIIASPTLGIEDKSAAVNNYKNYLQRSTSLRALVGNNAAAEPSTGETVEAETVRFDVAKSLYEVNAYQNYMQKLHNREVAKTDPSIVGHIASIAELMVPFVEQGNLASVLSDLKPDMSAGDFGQAITLLGESKEEMRQSIMSMPLNERIVFAERVADVLMAHKGILLTEENDFARLELLNTFLQGDYYTDTDRMIDNAFSLLDSTIFLAPLKGLFKGATRAVKGIAEARRAVDPSVTADVLKSMDPNQARIVGREGGTPGVGEIADDADGKAFKDTDMVPSFLRNKDEVESVGSTRNVQTDVQPSSVSQLYKEVNPEKARALHHAAGSDISEQVAQGAYGTSRTEAIVNDMVGTPANARGSVKSNIPDPDRAFRLSDLLPASIRDMATNSGALHYTKAEKVRARARVVNDFENAVGLSARHNMSVVESVPDGVNIKMVYGPTEGGFSSAEDAIGVTKFNLRGYGIDDSHIKLLKKDASGEYLPTTDLKGPGDYLASLDYKYDFSARTDAMASLDVKNNWLDFFGSRMHTLMSGSVMRHLLDPHSMLHPTLTKSASVAARKTVGMEKSLVELSQGFAKDFSNLAKDRMSIVSEFIRKANLEGLTYNKHNFRANGINDAEESILQGWKNMWDTIYWLENRDLVKTLKNRGFKYFVDKNSDTKLFARPVPQNQVKGLNNKRKTIDYYDPETDSIKTLDQKDISDLYESGGTIGELRTKITVDEDVVSFIVSRESKDSYLRALNDNDQVLSYRQGYYQVFYKDPYFIDRIVRDKNGVEQYRQAVATSGNTKDAKLIADRLAKTDGGEYVYRLNKDSMTTESDDFYDLSVSAGRTAQKVRGERLQEATSDVISASQSNVMDPVDSLTRSIRSISRRVQMRDWLESSKARFEKQFDSLIPKKEGQPVKFDNLTVKDFDNAPPNMQKKAADARTTYEYIRYMEDGYTNAMDELFKDALRRMAVISGDTAGGVPEKALLGAASVNPSQLAKAATFKIYLALNPLRQIIIQSHQAVRLFGINPKYVSSPAYAADAVVISAGLRGVKPPKWAIKASGQTEQQAMQMITDFKESGLWAAVDANNLVRQDLKKIAETTMFGKIKDIASAPINLSQKIGFDFGEQVNILSSWLVWRRQAVEKHGFKGLNREVMDDVTGNATNFTYNMDAAGDMPYNRNVLNVAFQFLQVPHKALTQVTTNRVLSRPEKIRMAIFDSFFWGVPGTATGGLLYTMLPDDPDVRHIASRGFESWSLNNLVHTIDGESEIDFSALAPYNVAGIYDVLTEFWTGGPAAMMAESPAGQLMGGRMQQALKVAARYFNVIDDYESPTEFSDVAMAFAQIPSGLSNMFKALYMAEYGKKISSSGATVDEDVGNMEALAQLFGFQTADESNYWAVSKVAYEASKTFKEDVTLWYDDLKKQLAREGLSNQDLEAITRKTSEAWRVFGNGNPEALKIVRSLIKRDVTNGESRLYKSMLGLGRIETPDMLNQLVTDAPISEEYKQSLRQYFNDLDSFRPTEE